MLEIIAIWVLALVLPFVAGPVIIRFTFRQNARFTWRDALPTDLTDEVAAFFQESAARFTAAGFSGQIPISRVEMNPGVWALICAYAKPSEKRAGYAGAIFSKAKGARRPAAMFQELVSSFDSGPDVSVNNSRVLVPLPGPGYRRLLQAPRLVSVEALSAAHTAFRNQAGDTGRLREVPLGEELRSAIMNSMEREGADRVAAGLMFRDGESGQFRLTWKGAALMSWSLLWPVTSVRRFVNARRADSLLRQGKGD